MENGNPVKLGQYPVYEASLTIAPRMARIEVTQISCTDFGPEDGISYDAIGIVSMVLVSDTEADNDSTPDVVEKTSVYEYTFGTFTNDASVTGTNVLTPDTDDTDTNYPNVLSAGDGKAWAWNIIPQNVKPLVTSLYVSGAGYTAINPNRTVTIAKYKDDGTELTEFAAGNIYRFAINFSHENMDTTGDYIIADVTVTIQHWTVKNLDVEFKTNSNN